MALTADGDDFLRALARGYSHSTLAAMVRPGPATAAATVHRSPRPSAHHTPTSARRAHRRRSKTAHPIIRRAVLREIPADAGSGVAASTHAVSDTERRLANLEQELYVKQRAHNESTQRRLQSLTASATQTREAAAKSDARLEAVEQQVAARRKAEAAAANAARALASRVAEIDRAMAEQRQEANAHSSRLESALARLATMQSRQFALGKEQQQLSSRLNELPLELARASGPSSETGRCQSSSAGDRGTVRRLPARAPAPPPPPPRASGADASLRPSEQRSQRPRAHGAGHGAGHGVGASCAAAADSASGAHSARHLPRPYRPRTQTLCEQVSGFESSLRGLRPPPARAVRRPTSAPGRPLLAPDAVTYAHEAPAQLAVAPPVRAVHERRQLGDDDDDDSAPPSSASRDLGALSERYARAFGHPPTPDSRSRVRSS